MQQSANAAVPDPSASPPAPPDRDALLATKLHMPRSRPGLVRRPRLTERLNQSLTRDLALVIAPAGYGKSIALTQWAGSLSQPVAWLSLDAQDNDPVRFWRHVMAALDTVRPGLSDRVGPLAGPPAPPTFDGLVTAVINDVAAATGDSDAVVILDDYHLITAATVHHSVRFLLQHCPPELHLVVASRADPPLGLPQFRANGQLTELRVSDLRFSIDEASAMLHEISTEPGQTLGRSAVAALAARTEGWAAGLQLAGLSLRSQPDVERFVAAFTGSHRYVLDYLTEEVLEGQDERVREFLLETSVLERLNGSLCDAVTGRSDSQQLLEQVDRSGLFVVQLDDVREWWRYHHLFADLLRSRLAQDPERARTLHRNAATWYQQRCLTDDTIHHALEAGDVLWAARLMEEHFDTVFNLRGETATIESWLPNLPADVVRTRPRLLLAQAQMASMRGDLPIVEQLLELAEQAVAGPVASETFEPTTGASGSLLVNVPAMIALQRSYAAQLRGDADATKAFASQALERVGDDELMLLSAIQGFFAVAEWLRGRLAEAEDAFASKIDWWRSEGQVTMTAWGDYCLARLQQAQGRLDAATRTSECALRLATPPGQAPLPAAGPALSRLATIAYQRDELDLARDHVRQGITLCRQFVHTPPLAACLVTQAWIRQVTGDPGGALDAMAEAGALSAGPPGLYNPVPAQRARLLLTQGDLAGAARWARDCGFGPDDEPDFPREAGQLILARVLIREGHPDTALGLLDRLEAAAKPQRRIASLIEIRALQAIAHWASDDDARAVSCLSTALQIAYPQRFIRVFADEGAALATVLGRVAAAQRSEPRAAAVPLGFLVSVQRAFDTTAGTGDPATERSARAAVTLIEPLTSREREILGLLAAGTSNRRIADELVVTVDTVKKHVSHVLAKLGAANRTEAVARGREVGAID